MAKRITVSYEQDLTYFAASCTCEKADAVESALEQDFTTRA